MAELTENLIKMGRELGYSGEQLHTFVKEEKAEIRQGEKEQRERQREEKEREREREEKEREREREEKEREREREREREEKEREREERRLKREAEEQERQAQLQLAKINAEIEISRANKSTTKNASHEFLSKVPKMVPFSESKGDTMDAFIFRFEMLVKSYDWSDDTKFLALSNLLTGDSLRVLQTLSLEQQNYNYLKQALLKKFLCTAADYNNNKFRNAIPLPSEDADAFISRLEMVFDRWVELSEIEKGNYEQLRDLILRDQIYSSLHSDIVMFLKERSPKSVKEIRSLAEKYRTAHPSKPLAKDHSILANVVSARQTEENRMRLKNKKIGKAGEISGTINILTALALNHADHLDFARIHGLPPDKCISGTNLHPREVTEVIVGETRTVLIHSAYSPEVHIGVTATITTSLQIVNMPHPHRL